MIKITTMLAVDAFYTSNSSSESETRMTESITQQQPLNSIECRLPQTEVRRYF